MPKTLVGISVSMLLVTAAFGVLNSVRVKGLHLDLANAIAARDAAERGRMAQAKEFKSRQTKIPRMDAKSADAESKAAKVEADLAKVQKEKADLETRLEANQYRRSSMMLAVSVTARNARKSCCPKQFGKPRSVRLSSKRRRSGAPPPEKQECAAPFSPVNQAYNFVVLNLGGRQGVEPNSEMLVVRDGTLIGKIHISSVEPARLSVTLLLAVWRVVSKCKLDIVIYAGTNS